VSPYLAIVSARYRMMLQYRAAALAGVGTQFFWGFIRIMILWAFYVASDAEPPMAFAAVVTYIWLSQALLGLLPWNLEPEIQEMIRTGGVSFELVRPLDLYSLWYARTLAMRTASTSLRVLPIVILAGAVLPFTPLEDWALSAPASLEAAALWLLATLAAIALGCAITNLVHVSLMWTISGQGVQYTMPSLVAVFSGMVIPLPLFPDAVQPLLTVLPFRGLVDVPLRIYTGHLAGAEAWSAIGLSAIWALGLVAIGRVLLERGCRRLVVQGG
jgi:ABC-2 type transport system permease protein